jgi:hypothetical protein
MTVAIIDIHHNVGTTMLSVVMLSVVMLSVVMLSVVILSVIMLSVVMLSMCHDGTDCNCRNRQGRSTNGLHSGRLRPRLQTCDEDKNTVGSVNYDRKLQKSVNYDRKNVLRTCPCFV